MLKRQRELRMHRNPYGKPFVVVADPDPRYERLMVDLLRPYFECLIAGSLREAWDATWRALAQAQRSGYWPLLLILELSQPDGNALRFVEFLHQHDILKSVLIACVSEQRSWRTAAFRAGADDFIVKGSTSWMQPSLPEAFAGMMLLLQHTGNVTREIARVI